MVSIGKLTPGLRTGWLDDSGRRVETTSDIHIFRQAIRLNIFRNYDSLPIGLMGKLVSAL
jgi:hypothetical protein